MEAWLDAGYGSCALRDANVRQLVVNVMTKFDGERLDLDCAVIMPNHVHVVLKPRGNENVFKLIGGMKGASARACNAVLHTTGQAFWMEDSYNRIVRDAEELHAFRAYIARNPVEAKLRAGEFTLIENRVLVP
jgi:REP element-mobilizing transposase RayT